MLVEKQYKGEIHKGTVTIYTMFSAASCGYTKFETGKKYIVYATTRTFMFRVFNSKKSLEKTNTYWTNQCSRTKFYDAEKTKTLMELQQSSIEKCSIEGIHIKTCKFVLNNLDQINKKFENKNALIEVSVEFQKLTREQEELKNYAAIKKVTFYLISPKNSYSGNNKKEVHVYSKLHEYIVKIINDCIENSMEFKARRYYNITFQIPLNKKNIKATIKSIENRKVCCNK